MNVWDKKIKVEDNSYFNFNEPIINVRKNNKNKFIHIDLFSGCGGFSCGFEQSGFITELAIDIHRPSIETIQMNHKNTSTVLGDIRKINPNKIIDLISNLEAKIVITAGVPCQGFSRSNRKRNDDDERNFYFREFLKFTKIIQPDAVIVENVSGIASAKDGYFINTISNEIENLGFKVSTSILNSADYGVPQIRKRFFFVGVKSSYNWLFPSKTHNQNNYVTVKDAILGDLPTLENNQIKKTYISKPTNKFQLLIRGNQKEILNHKSPNHPYKTIEMINKTKPGKPMYDSFKQRIRLNKHLPSPTQICGGIRPQFQFGHPTESRGLSIRERARIQTFPDSYFFSGGIVQGRVQTGNAVPVFVSRKLAEQLINLFRGETLNGEQGIQKNLDLFNRAKVNYKIKFVN